MTANVIQPIEIYNRMCYFTSMPTLVHLADEREAASIKKMK